MKAYLLGQLGERESSVLEECYFSDPLIYREVRRNEDHLIRDYLANRLAGADRERFESRYLVVPELAKRLEAIRNESSHDGTYRMRWAIILSGCLAVAIAFAWWSGDRKKAGEPARAQLPMAAATWLTVPLVPGVAKAGVARLFSLRYLPRAGFASRWSCPEERRIRTAGWCFLSCHRMAIRKGSGRAAV